MRSGILTALLVVFVDCMKELPATLILRPFNFDTLATHVYQFASDELLGHAKQGSSERWREQLFATIGFRKGGDREGRVLPGGAGRRTLERPARFRF